MHNLPTPNDFLRTFRSIRDDILPIYHDTHKKIKIKSDNSPVTQADLISQEKLFAFLKPLGFPIISEEALLDEGDFTALPRNEKSNFWVIDPLDGTKDFVQGTGEFSIMVGFVQEGNPIAGYMYQPTEDKFYFAEKGKGAFVKRENGKPEKLYVDNRERNLRLVVSRNHFLDSDQEIIDKLGIRDVVKCGSIGLKIGIIAEGKADIFINSSDKTFIWDSCAPQLLLKEAGGMITDINGNALVYDGVTIKNSYGILGTNTLVYEKVLSEIS